MKLNGKDLFEVYGARITQFTEQPLFMSKEVFYPKGKLMPVVLDKVVQAKQMYLELDFRDKEQISKLLPEVVEEFVLELDYEPEYEYRCQVLNMGNNVVMDDYDSYTVGFDVLVVKEKPSVNVILQSLAEQSFENEGTYESNAQYTITASADIENFVINDITINKMTSNETIIIDGEKKLIVFGNGNNAFDRCELYEFPKVQPGNNQVTMTNYENVSVQVNYKPVFF